MAKEPVKISLPQFPWYGDSRFEISFPPDWEIITCNMLGHDAKGVTKKEIQAAFDNPIGTTRISELARGKNEVAILFDDLSRPTKVAELVPYVLKEIKEGGISDERIRFVAASGAHGAMKLMDFRKKLGTKVAIVPDATIQYFPSLINRCAEEK